MENWRGFLTELDVQPTTISALELPLSRKADIKWVEHLVFLSKESKELLTILKNAVTDSEKRKHVINGARDLTKETWWSWLNLLGKAACVVAVNATILDIAKHNECLKKVARHVRSTRREFETYFKDNE
jgi:hypothetical protein